jgi:hypothetical protein
VVEPCVSASRPGDTPAVVSEHADQFEDEPGDEDLEERAEPEEPENEPSPWAKTSSGDADDV